MAQYLLLMRGGEDAFLKADPQERERMLEMYNAWGQQLANQSWLRGSLRLKSGGQILHIGDDGAMEINKPEVTNGIGAYLLVEANDYAAAAEIASHIPTLLQGGSIEIREVDSE